LVSFATVCRWVNLSTPQRVGIWGHCSSWCVQPSIIPSRRRAAILGEEAHAEQALQACRLPSHSPIKWRASHSRSGACVCRKPHPCWWSERIGYPGGMIALILFVLGILASPFKAKSRKVKSRPRLPNTDRWFLVQLYRWFPSILDVLTIIRPETLVRWHRAGFRRYWHWKSRRRGGRPQVQSSCMR